MTGSLSTPSPGPEAAAVPAQSRPGEESLAAALDRRTAEGTLWRPEGDKVRCVACGHRCLIGEGRRGICKVRFNQQGRLRVPFGYTAGVQCDPIEKKPFFHVYPGTEALTFGMLGCDFHCGYCQNWVTSQALRDAASSAPVLPITPAQLARTGAELRASMVVSSYNEPLITAEWAATVFREARAQGLECGFVSNGNATPEALDFIGPLLTAFKIDLKGFDDRRYRSLGGTLEHVTRSIQMVHERGLWLEIVTLLVPGFNDDPAELRALTQFVASVSRDIPWHVTAFHPDYQMTDRPGTAVRQLINAAEIGTAAGLRFVYAGNAPGRVGPWENTRCPACHETVIERLGYTILENRVPADGRCPRCATAIPGVWASAARRPLAHAGPRLPHRVSFSAGSDLADFVGL